MDAQFLPRIFFESLRDDEVPVSDSLHAVLLLEFQVLLPERVDAVNHLLHELDLGVAEAVLVGDVVGVACKSSSFQLTMIGNEEELSQGVFKS